MTLILAALIATATPACIARVHDGDTVMLCDGERIRLSNIDAPELTTSPRCYPKTRARLAASKNPAWCDPVLAEHSRAALQSFLAAGPVTIQRRGKDRYRRTLGSLSVNGIDAGEWLIGPGLARRWVR